jgi:hypothetical protein
MLQMCCSLRIICVSGRFSKILRLRCGSSCSCVTPDRDANTSVFGYAMAQQKQINTTYRAASTRAMSIPMHSAAAAARVMFMRNAQGLLFRSPAVPATEWSVICLFHGAYCKSCPLLAETAPSRESIQKTQPQYVSDQPQLREQVRIKPLHYSCTCFGLAPATRHEWDLSRTHCTSFACMHACEGSAS